MTALSLHGTPLGMEQVTLLLEQFRRTGWMPERGSDAHFSVCLPALISALKIDIEPNQLCDILPKKEEPLDNIDLQNCLADLGYIGRSFVVRMLDIDQRLLPCLFVFDQDSTPTPPVIILSKHVDQHNEMYFEVFFSQTETVEKVHTSLIRKGTAYFYCKEHSIEQLTNGESRQDTDFSWFRALLERFRGLFWQIFLLCVVTGVISLVAPLFVMLVYDKVINAHSLDSLKFLTVGALLALVTEWGLRRLRVRSLSWFGARLDTIVSTKIFEQLMLMPPYLTERASVSSQIARLKAFETVREFFNSPLFLSVIELPFTLVILMTIAFIAGPIAFVPVVTAILYAVLLLCMRGKLRAAMKLAARSNAKRQQLSVESYEKMSHIRACGMTNCFLDQFRDRSGKASMANFYAGYLSSIMEAIAQALFIIAGMVTIVWGVDRVWSDSMTTGALIACMILVWRVLSPFQTFCTSLPRFEQVSNAISQVNRLMNIPTERSNEAVKTHVRDIKGHISFNKVGLRYSKDMDPVFAGLSFQAKPGELVAITGGNGSGKSTILKLANGLYRPQAGNIRLDEVDIRQLDAIELRKNIAYVAQNPHFFEGTIADNLRFAEPLATDTMLQEALEKVQAWDIVMRLPQQLKTMIGTQHHELPTSLAYKLNLARAYLKNSQVMLFDELPYALLNSEAGEAYRQTLKDWKGLRTILMVSHREDYLKMADTVILLRKGDYPLIADPDTIINAIERSHIGV